jgi:hypothetical protein
MRERVKLEKCTPVIDNILDSIFEIPSTVLPLIQMNTHSNLNELGKLSDVEFCFMKNYVVSNAELIKVMQDGI